MIVFRETGGMEMSKGAQTSSLTAKLIVRVGEGESERGVARWPHSCGSHGVYL